MATRSRICDGDGDPRHGTPNGYVNLVCRCPKCREAWRVRTIELKAARKPLPLGDKRHGSQNGYVNYRCRCTLCQAAHAAAARKGRRAA